MRIAFAVPGSIDAPTGGTRYDRAVLAALRAAGHEVALLALGDSFPDPTIRDREHALAALAAVPPDTPLLVDGLAFGVLPAEALARLRAPLVTLVHHPLALETGLSADRAAALEVMERAALAHADGVVVTSPSTRDELVAHYHVPAGAITVAVPGLDPSWRQTRQPEDPPLIVSVGSVVPRKGFDVLLDALGRIADRPWRAVIAGSLDREAASVEALRSAAAVLGERVTIGGEMPEADIRALYASATVFALATRYEGFGMVFMEAMASGLPVVATAGGAVPDVVPPEAGLVVPVDDAVAMADALRRVLDDAELAARLSAGARLASDRAERWEDTAARIADRLLRASAVRRA